MFKIDNKKNKAMLLTLGFFLKLIASFDLGYSETEVDVLELHTLEEQ
jgi:hypothetical protein